MSVLARAPSISAPAAADEASQARAMSPASVASRRIWPAFPASCTALTSSACAARNSPEGRKRQRLLQNLRDRALNHRQAGRRAARQRLDLLESGLQPREQVERRLDRRAILPELRRTQRPAIARQLKPARRVEPRLDGRDQRGDRFGTLPAELAIARSHAIDQPHEAADVGEPRLAIGLGR